MEPIIRYNIYNTEAPGGPLDVLTRARYKNDAIQPYYFRVTCSGHGPPNRINWRARL